ncbi:hypothetical protein [Gloeocapsopsis sp. IPPAS B-1203]|uniref:hypothetical protein n=1 Tax=Gloeocapsopsis sp. IPPAS B-1203 TaxID=2049454 RepID=UPI000C180382|nr:hypothetical protein [Gloeocapsopsis sp. IPPAS B-1203]PIG94586.1 hypothetical protein CSQ79_04730 [Gloeocapsopsis sp. IPPAS B-1203]
MPISSVNRARSIIVPLNSASTSNIITVYTSSNLTLGSEFIEGYTIVSYNCFIKNLKAFVQINSLDEVALPLFSPRDTETDRLMKVIDLEWNNSRKQLNVFAGIKTNENWQQIGSISLINNYGYPFKIYNLMDLFTDTLALEIGDNGKIGVQIENVGYGLLEASDSVTIHGSYVEEIFLKSTEVTNYYIYGSNQNNTTPPDNTTPPNNQEEDSEMANWAIKSNSYRANIGEKLAFILTDIATLTLPNSNLTPGGEIKVIKHSNDEYNSYQLDIYVNGAFFQGKSVESVTLEIDNEEISFVFVNDDIGWIPTKPNALIVVETSSYGTT